MKHAHLITTMILATCLFSNAHPVSAQESFLPFQIPPWIAGEDHRPHSNISSTETHRTHQQKQTKQTPQRTAAPFTPHDYAPLLAQINPALTQDSTPSPLENFYADRVVEDIRQFGYDMFTRTHFNNGHEDKPVRSGLPAGAVQDHFVLGMGDKIQVTLRGQKQTQGVYTITNEGLLILEDMAPIPAAGRTIGQVRDALRLIASDLHNTDVFVSLESVNQVNILVLGHVNMPGRQTLTVFHTVLDALMDAGGVQKTGSLRQIKIIRNGRAQMIDLYALLVHGSGGMDLSLRDGDRIMVPSIGPTIAIAGGVKRPAIYEILPSLRGMRHTPEQSSEMLSLQESLDLAGGVLSPGDNRFLKLSMAKDGREITKELNDAFTPALGDGSILMVSRASQKRTEMIELAGHTRKPGLHALAKSKSLSALINSATVFGPDIYPLIGVIERTHPKTMTRQMIDFPPYLVLSGDYDRSLHDGDTVILFSQAQIQTLQKPDTPTKPVAMGSDDTAEEDLNLLTPALRSFLNERGVFVRGAVRETGLWPVSEGATLESVLAVAGGLSLDANISNIEITTNQAGENAQSNGRSGTHRITVNLQDTRTDTIALAPGDAVRVNQKFAKTDGQSVMILGEIHHPGKYDLLPGDTLSKLMNRAGGLTDHAYPDGAIFSRDADRRAEEARFRAAARELERAIAAASEKKDSPPDTEQLAMARDLANELRTVEGVGRITVEADPAVLTAQPALDILLQGGDKIYIPRRPLTVRVHGEVLSPANLQFRSNKTPNDYINEAGGMTYHADSSRAFALMPDGSAQPLMISAWNHKATFIPPGSTVVVPRDPKPFDFMTSARDFTQILSNLAITGIFLQDLRDD